MTAAVADLVEAALLLPSESRTELVEAILERSDSAPGFIAAQMETVRRRMDNVRTGKSALIPAEEAHRRVREALAAEA